MVYDMFYNMLHGMGWALATLLQKKDTNVYVDWKLFSSYRHIMFLL